MKYMGIEHHFPEEIKKKKVPGQEYACNACQGKQQMKKEKTGPIVYFRPGRSHGHESEDGGQKNQHEAKSIGGKREADAKLGYPGKCNCA